MKRDRRVLILAAPAGDDGALTTMRSTLAGWRKEADDRDVSIVEVVGNHVSGASDEAGVLRRRWRLPAEHFAAVLIGKDGREAYRTMRPVTAATLAATIDAMPMRRAGLR